MASTIREAYVEASSFLRDKAGNRIGQDPERVVSWMLEQLLGLTRSELFLQWHEPFPTELKGTLQHWLERKASGEPVQYIIGEAEFYGMRLKVNRDVLIPRPETELLVEEVLRLGARRWDGGGEAPHVADIGTGSGAIPIALAVRQPAWALSAVDISAAALATAIENAAMHGVAQRIEWMQGDLLAPLLAEGRRIDVLVSNPPYIPTPELARLQPEVKHEPMNALDGGLDGLVLYRRMIAQLGKLPEPPELIGFEVGAGQADDVSALLTETGLWPHVWIVNDLQGIGRHVMAARFSPI